MSYEVEYSKFFKKDIDRDKKSGRYSKNDFEILKDIINILLIPETLDKKYKEHSLKGEWSGYKEAHIKANWLLIYKIENNKLILVRLGTHSQLFKNF